MGLRFRRSISIVPGVKLNFGKTGMSVSAGMPGFHKTFHTSGKVTTSVGIPGTGIYYVDTQNPNRRDNSNQNRSGRTPHSESQSSYNDYSSRTNNDTTSPGAGANIPNNENRAPLTQLDAQALKSIHKACDDTVDWTEVLVSESAPDSTYNQQMWSYYHEMAPKVLSGDIDAYLQLIYEVNPLDDLLQYGGNFEFGTDDPKKIEVEFVVNMSALSSARTQMSKRDYNDLLQDYVASVCIRIARDMFALLPISNTIVHAVIGNDTVLSVDFDRTTLSKLKFGYIDPSDTMAKFRHNMEFDLNKGFISVDRIM